MEDNVGSAAEGRNAGRQRRLSRVGSLAVAVMVAGLMTGACSTDSSDKNGNTSNKAAPPSAENSQGSPKENSGENVGDNPKRAKAQAFVDCLRKNGVPDFPDPQPNGSILLDSNGGIDVQGATYKKAEAACKSLAPEGGRAAPPPGGKNTDIKKYVGCMRESGQPKFPDPDKGGFRGVDTSTPEFKAAHKACEKFSPAGAPPPGS
uniref:Uncharacterized protein n=1 Tax=uncultured soil bacterium TaxID=164851 RepID=E2D2F8_9BACT|nr:hypothetical protein [uncultured soil bacterium]